MNKETFLRLLNHRLEIINEKERQDIIDEYTMHIEMKMQEGKSEEDAIADFGDFDELVENILDAYKIDTKQVNQSLDTKINHFIDEFFTKFQRWIGGVVSINIEDVVRLIFEIIIALIFLFFLRFPFSFIGSLGSSLLSHIIGFEIGLFLGHLWELLIQFTYLVIVIVLIVNVCRNRLSKYRHKFQKKHSVEKNDEEENIKNEYDINTDRKEIIFFEDEANREEKKKLKSRIHIEKGFDKFIKACMRLVFCFLMIPLGFAFVSLCCGIGALIVLSFQGLTMVGTYFIGIGLLCIIGSFIYVLYRTLWRKCD